MPLFSRRSEASPPRPVLVVSMDGWIDAGMAASGAVGSLVPSVVPQVVATFDTDELLDHRARRPVVEITDGLTTGLTWPAIELRVGTDRNGAGVAALVGPEPDFRWKAFSADVVALARELDVRLAVGLGGFPAPVPHTRAVRLATTGNAPDMAHRIGFVQGTLEVPAGIQAALEVAFAEAGIPVIGLWARVPHYVAAMPFPAASAALIDGLNLVGNLSLDTAQLRTQADASLRRVDELIAQSSDHEAMVRQLEQRIDAAEGNTLDLAQMPTGDEIASELERYLRTEGGPNPEANETDGGRDRGGHGGGHGGGPADPDGPPGMGGRPQGL